MFPKISGTHDRPLIFHLDAASLRMGAVHRQIALYPATPNWDYGIGVITNNSCPKRNSAQSLAKPDRLKGFTKQG
jgi:hypothetical protein